MKVKIPHTFVLHTYTKPTKCTFCNKVNSSSAVSSWTCWCCLCQQMKNCSLSSPSSLSSIDIHDDSYSYKKVLVCVFKPTTVIVIIEIFIVITRPNHDQVEFTMTASSCFCWCCQPHLTNIMLTIFINSNIKCRFSLVFSSREFNARTAGSFHQSTLSQLNTSIFSSSKQRWKSQKGIFHNSTQTSWGRQKMKEKFVEIFENLLHRSVQM